MLRTKSCFWGPTTTTGFEPLVDLFGVHGDGQTNLLFEMGSRVLRIVFVDPLETANLQNAMDNSTLVDTAITTIS